MAAHAAEQAAANIKAAADAAVQEGALAAAEVDKIVSSFLILSNKINIFLSTVKMLNSCHLCKLKTDKISEHYLHK